MDYDTTKGDNEVEVETEEAHGAEEDGMPTGDGMTGDENEMPKEGEEEEVM